MMLGVNTAPSSSLVRESVAVAAPVADDGLSSLTRLRPSMLGDGWMLLSMVVDLDRRGSRVW
jgi:hypothetical protein